MHAAADIGAPPFSALAFAPAAAAAPASEALDGLLHDGRYSAVCGHAHAPAVDPVSEADLLPYTCTRGGPWLHRQERLHRRLIV